MRHRAFYDGETPFFGGSGGLRRRNAYNNKSRPGASTSGQSQSPMSRQVLDHDSLVCLLLLLFVEETKLNTNFLHRIFRNLCYHSPTRDWLVASLVAVLQRAGELQPPTKAPFDTSAMEVTPSSPPKMQKQFPKKVSWPSDVASVGTRNRSWMSIRLEAALGSRSSIFQVSKHHNYSFRRNKAKHDRGGIGKNRLCYNTNHWGWHFEMADYHKLFLHLRYILPLEMATFLSMVHRSVCF